MGDAEHRLSDEDVIAVVRILEGLPYVAGGFKFTNATRHLRKHHGFDLTAGELSTLLRRPCVADRLSAMSSQRFSLVAVKSEVSRRSAKRQRAAAIRSLGKPESASGRYRGVLAALHPQGYGFVSTAGGTDIFVPPNAICRAGIGHKSVGGEVRFTLEVDEQARPYAKDLVLVKPPSREAHQDEHRGTLGYVSGAHQGAKHRASHVVPRRSRKKG